MTLIFRHIYPFCKALNSAPCPVLTSVALKYVWRPGSARTWWEAYSAPPDPVAWFGEGIGARGWYWGKGLGNGRGGWGEGEGCDPLHTLPMLAGLADLTCILYFYFFRNLQIYNIQGRSTLHMLYFLPKLCVQPVAVTYEIHTHTQVCRHGGRQGGRVTHF